MDPSTRSAALYYRMPASMQSLVLSAAGWRQARIRFGRAFDESLSFLRGSDRWGEDRIREHQDASVASIVAKAYEETDYYHSIMDERGLAPADVRGVADLPKLPILTKEDIRANRDRMVAKSARTGRLHTIQTSGSTGPPMRILTPRRSLAFKWAVWWRHRERFGLSRGARYATAMAAPWVPADARRPPYWRWNRVENQALIPMQQIVPGKIESIVGFLDTRGFDFWAGYPSILSSLVHHATDAGLELTHKPRAVFTGAETLFDHQRSDIVSFTGAPVSQMYGFNEAAANASECPEGSLHEDFEFGVMECADPVVDEETGNVSGSIIATGFGNDAMPLIRYEVGDVGIWRPDGFRCACGRQSTVLAAVDGRLEDYVITPEGLRVRRIGDIFMGMPALRRFQVVQTHPEGITIRLVVDETFTQADENVLRRRVARWISDSLSVGFEYVDAIAPGPSGKVERVVGTLSEDR